MGIIASQLSKYVITPVLKKLNLWSESAERLLLGTLAQESHMGSYLHQINGPALGIYQIEPTTHKDIWINFLTFQPTLANTVTSFSSFTFPDRNSDEELIGNLNYATAIARVHYLRAPESLPAASDIVGLAQYWKQYYNSLMGQGTVEEFINNYKRHVAQ